MRIPNHTLSAKIGVCPACSEGVYGNADLEVALTLPGTVPQGASSVDAKVSTRTVGFAVNHRCGSRPDFPPEEQDGADEPTP